MVSLSRWQDRALSQLPGSFWILKIGPLLREIWPKTSQTPQGPVHILGKNCQRSDPHIAHMGYYLGPHMNMHRLSGSMLLYGHQRALFLSKKTVPLKEKWRRLWTPLRRCQWRRTCCRWGADHADVHWVYQLTFSDKCRVVLPCCPVLSARQPAYQALGMVSIASTPGKFTLIPF